MGMVLMQVPWEVWRAMIAVPCAQILGLLLAQAERLERTRKQFAVGEPVARLSRLEEHALRSIRWVLVAMGWRRSLGRGARLA